MKLILLKIFLFLLVFSTIFYKSQKVTVRGIAKDTTKNRNFVMVVINDTLIKHKGDVYSELLKNKYRVFADKQGYYQIKAKPTDTLYFYSDKYFTQNIK